MSWALVFSVPVARANYEGVGRFATSGEGGLSGSSEGVAVDDASGEVYVADGFHRRVSMFDSEGAFLGAWGANVVETGPDQKGTDQVEEIFVRATGGQFTLNYLGSETKPLNFNVSAKLVEEELNKLSSVESQEGKFSVKPLRLVMWRMCQEIAIG
jgi:DNA-binding beta-propeller fold protein YncE